MTKQHHTAANSASHTPGFALPVRIAHPTNTHNPPASPPPTATDAPAAAFLAGALTGAVGMFALGAYLGRRRLRTPDPCEDADFPPGPPYEPADHGDPFADHFGPFYDDDADDERGG